MKEPASSVESSVPCIGSSTLKVADGLITAVSAGSAVVIFKGVVGFSFAATSLWGECVVPSVPLCRPAGPRAGCGRALGAGDGPTAWPGSAPAPRGGGRVCPAAGAAAGCHGHAGAPRHDGWAASRHARARDAPTAPRGHAAHGAPGHAWTPTARHDAAR